MLEEYHGPENPATYEGGWEIKLNRYQRDNLLFVLNVIGYGDKRGIWPFSALDSGDWLGEITQKLAKPKSGKISYTIDEQDRPNLTIKALQDIVATALGFALARADKLDVDYDSVVKNYYGKAVQYLGYDDDTLLQDRLRWVK